VTSGSLSRLELESPPDGLLPLDGVGQVGGGRLQFLLLPLQRLALAVLEGVLAVPSLGAAVGQLKKLEDVLLVVKLPVEPLPDEVLQQIGWHATVVGAALAALVAVAAVRGLHQAQRPLTDAAACDLVE
jgi:hypothetical protein